MMTGVSLQVFPSLHGIDKVDPITLCSHGLDTVYHSLLLVAFIPTHSMAPD